jgi:hypothetical protein
MLSEDKAYNFVVNGEYTGLFVNLQEVLLSLGSFDVITFQQVSHQAPRYDTYQPYLNELVALARKCAPKAKIYLQETWAYEQGSARLTNELHYEDQADMYRDVHDAYKKAAEEIGADGIIPSGEAMLHLAQSGVRAHRDGFHASLAAGRYAIALTWAGALLGLDPRQNTFSDFDVPATEAEILAAKEAAAFALGL